MQGYSNYGITAAEMEENMFFLKVKCSTPPCTLKAITAGPMPSWPYGLLFTISDSIGYELTCQPSIVSPIGLTHLYDRDFPGILDIVTTSIANQDTLYYYSFYHEFTYSSIPKSLRSLNLTIKDNKITTNGTSTAPSAITVVDMLGRQQYSHTWPKGELSIPLPSLSGLHMIRLRYPDGATAVVRHQFGEW
jgi:hypothetical protein